MTRSTRTPTKVDDLKTRYRAGKVGDVEVKTKLAAAMNAVLNPMRERRRAIMSKPDRIREIAAGRLAEGARHRPAHHGTRPRRGEAAILNVTEQHSEHSDFRIVARRLQGQAR
jgi:hypothetical protein